jgi:hypothetical protein
MLQNNEERTENAQSSRHALGPVTFQPDVGSAECRQAPIVKPLEPGSQAGRDRCVDAEMVGEQEVIDLQERPQRVPDFTLGSVSLSETQGEELVSRYVSYPIAPSG